MLLTVTTTHRPATDLGYLLVKHPDRMHAFDLPTGTAYVFYAEASEECCTAALLLDVDPQRLLTGTRNRGGAKGSAPDGFTLGQYVNDRPYATSSLLASALAKVFRSALRGESRDRPELAGTPIPLEVRVPVLRCQGGPELVGRLFAPLGWTVTATAVGLDEEHPEWGASRYVDLTLTGTLRLADALNHLYVLLPVLDDAKHYWVAPEEIDKLLRAGAGWLADHPERALVTRRYLAHQRALAQSALDRLAELRLADEPADADTVTDSETDSHGDGGAGTAPDPVTGAEPANGPDTPVRLPSLAAQRRTAVLAALADSGASRVLDLGCGGGALLVDLVADRRYTEIVGTDVSTAALAMAERRLRLDRLPERQRDRIRLWQSALTYRDDRLRGYDAAVLMEVIEHVDPSRLDALEAAVFGHAQPGAVVVTTPNVEYNVRYEGLPAGQARHHDHRFEWTRAEFADWAHRVADTYGYRVALSGIGGDDPEVGAPTQLAVLTRATTTAAGQQTVGTVAEQQATGTVGDDEKEVPA
ncbi:3' terminal RNA ribose 2'-O-methyltransferase Hen1 [Micromonospora echinofusca]|uniref:Small RNA 2'-O-methyltransferase n=1 Tax=Micromonospora echinofusca TaxID=47858 RepID=A0ABS3VRD1_MICEH|nr:3' terminal RNA ribose 2'-O-methyltransferase Hen1 [Micromonospora echinofusca]MBO4207041.1 3' terminal RNA ribose 2'-O-methyltransferase Hen1 [Micromonospora echinofusca]